MIALSLSLLALAVSIVSVWCALGMRKEIDRGDHIEQRPQFRSLDD